jgi:hypothetical protein
VKLAYRIIWAAIGVVAVPTFAVWPFVAAGCGPLTPGGAKMAEDVYAAACPLLSLVPVVGPLLVEACVGEEQALADALAAVLARQAAAAADAGAAKPTATSLMASATGPRTAVFAMRKGKRTHVGYVPASLAADVQAELDKAPR